MFKTLLKKLVGDKVEGDMKEIQPVVDAVHGFEADMKALSDDGLRSRSEDLRQRIQAHVADLEKEEQALRADASAMGEDQLEQKEAIYEQIDGLTKRIDEALEAVLETIMPEAFALVKETSRRLAETDSSPSRLQIGIVTSRQARRRHHQRRPSHVGQAWMAAGSEVQWNMVHYDVQLVGGAACTEARWRRCKRVRARRLSRRSPYSSTR